MMAVFPWCWCPWGCKTINVPEPFWEKLFHTETGPFLGSFFQEWTSFFHRGTILNQTECVLKQCLGNCLGGRGWGSLLLSFVPSYITLLAVGTGCPLTFSDKAVTNYCRCPGAQSIAVWWIVDKINTATDLEVVWTTQVATSLTDSVPGWAPLCYLWFSVIRLKERGVEGIKSSALTLIAQNFHSPDWQRPSPLSSLQILRKQASNSHDSMPLWVRLLHSPPSSHCHSKLRTRPG